MKYNIIRTDKADEGIRHTVLYLANHFGNEFALEKLDYIENTILLLEDNPYIGTLPRYAVLKRQGYRVLILEKNLVQKLGEKNGEHSIKLMKKKKKLLFMRLLIKDKIIWILLEVYKAKKGFIF